ncbi:MAG TPA: alpha/beta fold hydrolase [Candidatus Limnocylindrales bacterium]
MTAPAAVRSRAEQTRARDPDRTGFVDGDGARIYYEVYGEGDPPIMFVPPWSIVHSRVWKGQIPSFARRHKVIAWDAPGNGRSSKPSDPAAHHFFSMATHLLAVMDATETPAAVLVGVSASTMRSIVVAARHPERVLGMVLLCPSVPLGEPAAGSDVPFDDPLPTDEGWAKENIHFWQRDFEGYLEFFAGEAFNEPHSTKQIEDLVGWGLGAGVDGLAPSLQMQAPDLDIVRALFADVRCPVLVVQGDRDAIAHPTKGPALAQAIAGARLVEFEGGGHLPNCRHPVKVNLMINDFVESLAPPPPMPSRTWIRALARRRRALYISSPIGLGHAQRDAAIAAELRKLRPEIEIDWLAQHPVTAVLEERGERVHPASAELASESGHFVAEATEHDLNAFQAIRRMDEIQVANFMVFHEVVEQGEYDLVIGDEAWDVDYFLHENPELKRTAFAWMTDFVGWLPMPDGGDREAYLTADYNAEMIEHVARFPYLRDRSIFVGDPDDIVPDAFGPGMPTIRDWTEQNFRFAGYVTGFDPTPLVEGREALRRELGYHPDERVVVVTVGGSGVGSALLRRVVGAFPEAARLVPGLRMIAVAGPRIEPASLAAPPGVEVRAFVPDLYRHLAASDLAVVQGGLSTTMELVAARRPFLYFPLQNHFEQQRHVAHRLDRYRAGRRMDYATSTSETIAAAIAEEIDRPVDYRPVTSDGAARAAAMIAELI